MGIKYLRALLIGCNRLQVQEQVVSCKQLVSPRTSYGTKASIFLNIHVGFGRQDPFYIQTLFPVWIGMDRIDFIDKMSPILQ